MECVICQWKGHKKGYDQHCSTEKHQLRVQLHELQQEQDPYSSYQLTKRMTLEEIHDYIKQKIDKMPVAQLKDFATRILLSKTETELRFRMTEDVLFS